MDDGILVAFLFEVDKNLASVGLGGSECDRMSKDDRSVDIRVPAPLKRDLCNTMVEGLDRGLPPVTTWQQLYTWLGRGHGWAYFTSDSANSLLPHWFGRTEYRCRQNNTEGYRSGPFIDLDAFHDGVVRFESKGEMIGPDAEESGETKRLLEQFKITSSLQASR